MRKTGRRWIVREVEKMGTDKADKKNEVKAEKEK